MRIRQYPADDRSAPLLVYVLLYALTSLACACAMPRLQASTSASEASDFEATIARIERSDPESPAVLNAQLAYADFLLSGASGPCAQRLERAQERLGSVDANPRTRVMFPDGWARVSSLEYRLHLERAACGSATDRETELRIAVAAARRAGELYRKTFDYRSMAIMQFDVATVLHQLGENAAALSALATVLDLDREYGFEDDARESCKLLLTWSRKPAGDAEVAALMQGFPKRRAVLRFEWRSGNARITLESHRERFEDGQILASHAAAGFERRVAPDNEGGWSVTYSQRLTGYQPGVWPAMQGSQTPPEVFPPALFPAVGFKVSATGEFEGVTDSAALAARLAAETEDLIRAAAPPGEQARGLVKQALAMAAADLAPGMLEAETAEIYRLETAMWIGATLDQGGWYEVSAPLSLAGMPRVVVENRIQFAFTRMVPCPAGATQPTCVEIVYHATPDQRSLDEAMADLGKTRSQSPHYTAATEARIVTDPATLMPYTREAWVHWYVSFGRSRKDKTLQSEHHLSITSYRTD